MAQRINLVGQTYGDFTVLEMLYGYKYINDKPRTYCRCIGVDNIEYIIRADALRSGATTSIKNVGHFSTCLDLQNQKFGLLTALYKTDKKASNGNIIWYCLCDCGTECEVPASSLKSGHTLSCGCNKRSKWELFIEDYLKELNIEFECEKRFKDCVNTKGTSMLPFDFYLYNNNKIIEYDGLHHFEPIPGWGGEEKFKITKMNDGIKNDYCRNNHIELLRIPYYYSKEDIKKTIDEFLMPVTITA